MRKRWLVLGGNITENTAYLKPLLIPLDNRSTRLEPLNATGLLRFWTALGAAALPTEVHEVAILDFKVLSNTTLLTY